MREPTPQDRSAPDSAWCPERGEVPGYIGVLAWELSEHGEPIPALFTTSPDGFRCRTRDRCLLLDRVVTHGPDRGQTQTPPDRHRREAWQLTVTSSALAESSVAVLKPDLIILDEFQRFRELMNPDTEAGELAHHLYDHSGARVLLLSATPYKPFTYGEEEEDHARDFHQLLDFLAGRTDPVIDVRKTRELLAAYRESVTRGDVDADVRELLSSNLRTVMSRWERPRIGIEAMAAERVRVADKIDPEDLAGSRPPAATCGSRCCGVGSRVGDSGVLEVGALLRGSVRGIGWRHESKRAVNCLGGALSVAMSAVPSLSGEARGHAQSSRSWKPADEQPCRGHARPGVVAAAVGAARCRISNRAVHTPMTQCKE